MATLTTKFDMGQTVWFASTSIVQKQHDCPDCLGSKKWECTSPAGGKFEVACPRCGGGYQSNRDLSLTYSAHARSVRRLTIGQIRASTEIGDSYDAGNRYMCLETGVGSGNVYGEADLHATEEEARAHADAKANVANADQTHWVAKQYDQSVKFSDYELKDAVMAAAEDKARNALYAVSYLLEDLDGADTLEEVARRIATWREEREAA